MMTYLDVSEDSIYALEGYALGIAVLCLYCGLASLAAHGLFKD